jgi:cell volume regulation protein A
MLAGSEGIGHIYFDDHTLAKEVGTLALAFILFHGGLNSEWADIKSVILPGIGLSTIGVLLSAILIALFASYFLKFSFIEGFLLGSIISATDIAAVLGILKNSKLVIRKKVKNIIEFESASNDPMAAFLTIQTLYLINSSTFTLLAVLEAMIVEMIIGVLIGYLSGIVTKWITSKVAFEYKGIYPVFSVAMVLFTYSYTNILHGNSFLAVYTMGLVMSSYKFIHKNELVDFHDILAWFMEILIFFMIGLLVFPSTLVAHIPGSLILTLFLLLIARPASVFLTLSYTEFNNKEKVLISWVGLRGAAPIILATFIFASNIESLETMFNIIFLVVIISILLQVLLLKFFFKFVKL